MPLVEVIRGAATDDAAVATALAVGAALRKNCVLVQDSPAFVVNRQIARAALGKQHADEVQYTQLVTANTAVAPIHSGLDGGMNRVFLAQVGGSIPPARVPPPGSQSSPATDNNDSFASRLLGWFGWKSAPRTQVASADSTTLERGAHSAATGSILAPKIKSAPQGYTVASATPN